MDCIISLLAFWSVFHFWCSVVSENVSSERRNRRFKRIIWGIDLASHDQLGTQYMVSIKEVHGCESAAAVNRKPNCDRYGHVCGGALVAPDFVLTACHCIIDEHYQVKGVALPPFHPGFDSYTSSTVGPRVGGAQVIHVRLQPLHPIYNTMSLWMGSVDIENMPQRQFAKSFFPHSNCTVREINVLSKSRRQRYELSDLWPTDQDIGLVRAWIPFFINADVKLVPLKHGDEMLQFHRSVMASMSVCLFTAYGVTENHRRLSRYLRYNYRHVLCTTRCHWRTNEVRRCEICSSSIARPDKGLRIANVWDADSGSPLVCDDGGTNFLLGVLSASDGAKELHKVNATNAIFASVACIKDLLTKEHLQYLRETDDLKPIGVKLDKVPMGAFEEQ